jgi:hypothetical protein
MASDDRIKDYVEKLADDKLAEVMSPKPAGRVWTEDARGGRWQDEEREWQSYKPVVRKVDDDELPLFLDRRKPKKSQYGVSIESQEDWAGVVRPQGGTVVLSDFMVTKVVDILMRDFCESLERAQLVFVGEDASRNVREGLRKVVGEYVYFLDKRTGEYCDVEVE